MIALLLRILRIARTGNPHLFADRVFLAPEEAVV
jgi:hypothetical protein